LRYVSLLLVAVFGSSGWCLLRRARAGLKYFTLLDGNEVDMEALSLMSESHLKEMGMPMGPRLKLVEALRAQNGGTTPTGAASAAASASGSSAAASAAALHDDSSVVGSADEDGGVGALVEPVALGRDSLGDADLPEMAELSKFADSLSRDDDLPLLAQASASSLGGGVAGISALNSLPSHGVGVGGGLDGSIAHAFGGGSLGGSLGFSSTFAPLGGGVGSKFGGLGAPLDFGARFAAAGAGSSTWGPPSTR
jgi:hypothetical protein